MVEMWHRLTQDVCWPQAFNVCYQVRGRGAAGGLSDHQEVSTAQAEVTGETEARPSGGRQADSGDQPGSHHHTCHLPGSHQHLTLHTNLAHSQGMKYELYILLLGRKLNFNSNSDIL